jgi:hypothetical protein
MIKYKKAQYSLGINLTRATVAPTPLLLRGELLELKSPLFAGATVYT